MSIHGIQLTHSYGYGSEFPTLSLPQNLPQIFHNSSEHACKISELLVHI